MKRMFAVLLVFALLQSSACSLLTPGEPTSVDPDYLIIRTDQDLYTPSETVTVTFTNRSGADVVLLSDGCSALNGKPLPLITAFERREGTAWADERAYGCIARYQPPVLISNGQRYSVSFHIRLMDESLEPGTYRFGFGMRWAGQDSPGDPLPQELQFSNEFVVESR